MIVKGGSLITNSGSDDFAGLKPYMLGDSLQRISWKHVAKQQQWVSKSFESETSVNRLVTVTCRRHN